MTHIRVNVYDLTKANGFLRALSSKQTNFGVYHSSVVVGEDFEIYYGFYRRGVTGVDYANFIDTLPLSMSGTLYSSYDLGYSHFTLEEIRSIARKMSLREEWLSDRYNILQHNCHTFSLAFCKEILLKAQLINFPAYVFKCEDIGNKLYDHIGSLFIDEENPPFFLSKQPDQSICKNSSSQKSLEPSTLLLSPL